MVGHLVSLPFPIHRYKAVWLIFFVLGLGTLLPWNFFVTASQVRLRGLGPRGYVHWASVLVGTGKEVPTLLCIPHSTS